MNAALRRGFRSHKIWLGIMLCLVCSGQTQPGVATIAAMNFWETLIRYNTRIVLLGTTILGVCGGVVGVFMLLRKRSLVGDVVGHAALPGIAIAFLIMETAQPGTGKTLSGLLLGGASSAVLGVVATLLIVKGSRIKEDAALAIVLSMFYGLGIALFTVIQSIPSGSSAGLRDFVFGKAALMTLSDVQLIGQASCAVLIIACLLFKEFSLLCFDEAFASTMGWPITFLDLMLMGLVVTVTIVGIQCVGLILVVAILIIPAAAARFWTDHLIRMTIIAGALGGVSAFAGVLTSSLVPKLATGAIIVVIGAAFFLVSLLFGTKRGIVYRLINARQLRQRVGQHDLLRASFEVIESKVPSLTIEQMTNTPMAFAELQAQRSWTAGRLRRLLLHARQAELIWKDAEDAYRLTPKGIELARRAVRNHRMWELYLIHHADIAPAHVDRGADRIEHILEPAMIAELETLMEQEVQQIPQSPHELSASSSNE